jgi:glycosyltransferase involved in cell wall biosynthesis
VPPTMSVIICTLNGAAGVDRCLRALADQTARSELELIVVDDGSTDDTSHVARGHGALVVRHEFNQGVSVGRNSGADVATAPLLAFLDDDCEPDPCWAERLINGYAADIVAHGGELIVGGGNGYMFDYLARHNPLAPQELDLAHSSGIAYRFYLYLKRQWASTQACGQRDVFSFAAANMSVRRQEFLHLGGFDKRIHFAGEDEDLCRRLRLAFPSRRLMFSPDARVLHHFEPSLRDTLRRRRAYGRGAAFQCRKWHDVRPTFFPWPVAVLGALGFSAMFPEFLAVAAVLPPLLYPQGLRAAIAQHSVACLIDPYVQLAEEFFADLGFAEGLWRFRRIRAERMAD